MEEMRESEKKRGENMKGLKKVGGACGKLGVGVGGGHQWKEVCVESWKIFCVFDACL